MVSLKGKLGHLKRHMQLEPERKIVKQEIKTTENVIPHLEQWEKLGARPHWFDGHYTMIREVSYPLAESHGCYSFGKLAEVVERWQEHTTSHPLSTKGKQAKDLLFFDTETTGLNTGAGTSIFFARL